MDSQLSNLLADSESDTDSEIDPELALEQVLADPDLIQHIARYQRDGVDTVVAHYRCQFAPRQQTCVLQIPLVPPMSSVPEVEVIVTDDSLEARVRITDRQKFGIRSEIILNAPTETVQSLLVEVIVSAQTQCDTN